MIERSGQFTPQPSSTDEDYEKALRPKSMDEFIGQQHIKDNLRVFMTAAQQRGECLDHVLLSGPPGLGKTTLAYIIGAEMGAQVKTTSGPVLDKPASIAGLLTNLNEGDVLFIDEIHRLSPVVEEVLYPAMEDYQIDIVIGEGPGARSVKLPLPRFTLVGATTRAEPSYREDGSLQHAELVFGDSVVMMGEPRDGDVLMPASLYVYVDDCEARYERALAAGAVSVMEPELRPHGDRFGGVRDSWGNHWWIVTHVGLA